MKKVILMRGLPGSGKTHWAKQLQRENRGQYKRINKDELRSMLDDGKWSRDNEELILRVRDNIILEALNQGKSVIVDDTNFSPKHEARIKQVVGNMAEVVIEDFTHVPIDICIKQDLQRINAVGEKVIRRMYNQFLRPKSPPIVYDKNLTEAIMVDLDGTLALFGNANPYERDFEKDEVNRPVLDIIKRFEDDIPVLFISGRKAKFRKETIRWLRKYTHWLTKDIDKSLYMPRADDDNRPDVVIKKEIYEANIRNKYNINFVIDDRLQVCRLWHSLGLTVFRVGDPDADF